MLKAIHASTKALAIVRTIESKSILGLFWVSPGRRRLALRLGIPLPVGIQGISTSPDHDESNVEGEISTNEGHNDRERGPRNYEGASDEDE